MLIGFLPDDMCQQLNPDESNYAESLGQFRKGISIPNKLLSASGITFWNQILV